jgi:hypothetical protein
VTEYNLLLFFSDLIEIVLKNPKFSVSALATPPPASAVDTN